MSKENFYTLLSRYRSGQCTVQEKELVEAWFATLEEEVPSRDDRENKAIEEKIWNSIQHQTGTERPIIYSFIWKWAAAAIVILALAWVGYQYKPTDNKQLNSLSVEGKLLNNLLTEENHSNVVKTLNLPDGSEILLSPHSSLSYSRNLEGINREVFLTGNAFFRIIRDIERPFYVHRGEVVTKVLGTSFWITGSSDNRSIEVAVVSGKVSVSKQATTNSIETSKIKDGVILTANQRVKYSSETHAFETGLVENPIPVVSSKEEIVKEELFVFVDSPFSEVIEKLEKSYGIEIILENEAFRKCLFKGNITQQPLFTKLDLLCASVNASYEVRGTRILISGKGCQSETLNP